MLILLFIYIFFFYISLNALWVPVPLVIQTSLYLMYTQSFLTFHQKNIPENVGNYKHKKEKAVKTIPISHLLKKKARKKQPLPGCVRF